MVEDNSEDFEIFNIAFQDLNIANPLIRFSTGTSFLNYMKGLSDDSLKPKLIVLDLNLVDLDGRTIVSEVRSGLSAWSVPIMVYSTSANPKDVEKCYAAGANAYVVKPVNIENFYEVTRLIRDFWLNFNITPGEMYGRT